ncbi:MAG TPA: hypothetical protein VF593_02815 [Chthoniobacteraceae bacterium]
MPPDQPLYFQPFALGFYLGCVFLLLALYQYFRLKGELARFRRHLSDKLEIEAETMKKIKLDQEGLRRENESLRIKVNALNETPDRKVSRDLEVYARAEKRMLLNAPGFAPAWETAKTEAHNELAEEETGKAPSKRIFARLFGGGTAPTALPGRDGAGSTTTHENEGTKVGTEG